MDRKNYTGLFNNIYFISYKDIYVYLLALGQKEVMFVSLFVSYRGVPLGHGAVMLVTENILRVGNIVYRVG